MAFQEGVLLRNASLNGKTTQLGATATCKIFTGAEPANCAAADPAGVLVTISLNNPVFNTAAAASMTLNGTPSAAATATGTAASFRIYDSSGVCQMQGAINADMALNNTSIASGQTVTINSFSITAGNA